MPQKVKKKEMRVAVVDSPVLNLHKMHKLIINCAWHKQNEVKKMIREQIWGKPRPLWGVWKHTRAEIWRICMRCVGSHVDLTVDLCQLLWGMVFRLLFGGLGTVGGSGGFCLCHCERRRQFNRSRRKFGVLRATSQRGTTCVLIFALAIASALLISSFVSSGEASGVYWTELHSLGKSGNYVAWLKSERRAAPRTTAPSVDIKISHDLLCVHDYVCALRNFFYNLALFWFIIFFCTGEKILKG